MFDALAKPCILSATASTWRPHGSALPHGIGLKAPPDALSRAANPRSAIPRGFQRARLGRVEQRPTRARCFFLSRGKAGMGVKRRMSSSFCVGDAPRRGGPAASHFSCLAKKSNQKKATRVRRLPGDETSGQLPCAAHVGGRASQTRCAALRSDSEARRPPPPLRCSAALTGKKSVAARPLAEILCGRCAPTPPVRAAEQRRAVGGSRRALSEPEGRVAQPPDRSSSAGQLSGSFIAGQPANPGRLFFGYFLLAKQKKVTCRRATPGAAHPPRNLAKTFIASLTIHSPPFGAAGSAVAVLHGWNAAPPRWSMALRLHGAIRLESGLAVPI